MTQVQMYTFSVMCEIGDFAIERTPDAEMRVTKIYTTATKPEAGVITGLIINGVNQLMLPIGAWEFAVSRLEAMRAEFLARHGLTGMSYLQIDAYLDAHELSMPEPNRIELPTIGPKTPIKITGRFRENLAMSFMGLARIE